MSRIGKPTETGKRLIVAQSRGWGERGATTMGMGFFGGR